MTTPKRQKAIKDAMDFLSDAAAALDQAHACMKDIGVEKLTPIFGSECRYVDVFPNYDAVFTVTEKHLLSVTDLEDALLGLRMALRDTTNA